MKKFYQERNIHHSICIGYHGTSTDAAVSILKYGFRGMDVIKNGNLYGNGVYLAKGLDYSKRYSLKKNGLKIVLVTCFIKGKSYVTKKETQSTNLDLGESLTGGDGKDISVVWWNNLVDIQITHALVWVEKEEGGGGGRNGGGSGGGGSSGGGSGC